MKLKTIFFTLCLVVGVVVGYAMAADNGPAKININVDGKGKAVKNFDHHKHQQMPEIKGKCAYCHHTMKAGEKPKKCEACHTDKSKKDAKTGAIGFKKAFHDKCQKCHNKKAKETGKKDLKKCKACHK